MYFVYTFTCMHLQLALQKDVEILGNVCVCYSDYTEYNTTQAK